LGPTEEVRTQVGWSPVMIPAIDPVLAMLPVKLPRQYGDRIVLRNSRS
jgi:hypothetical protein